MNIETLQMLFAKHSVRGQIVFTSTELDDGKVSFVFTTSKEANARNLIFKPEEIIPREVKELDMIAKSHAQDFMNELAKEGMPATFGSVSYTFDIKRNGKPMDNVDKLELHDKIITSKRVETHPFPFPHVAKTLQVTADKICHDRVPPELKKTLLELMKKMNEARAKAPHRR